MSVTPTCLVSIGPALSTEGVSKQRDMELDSSDYEDVGNSSVNGKSSLSRMGEWAHGGVIGLF